MVTATARSRAGDSRTSRRKAVARSAMEILKCHADDPPTIGGEDNFAATVSPIACKRSGPGGREYSGCGQKSVNKNRKRKEAKTAPARRRQKLCPVIAPGKVVVDLGRL